MSTEDLTMISQLLLGINNPDKQIRTEAESKIKTLSQNLGALSFCLIQIGAISSQNPQDMLVKQTALVILRKILDQAGIEKWKEIAPELKQQIKNESLKLFINENIPQQKHHVREVLTQIIDNVSETDEEWPELKSLALSLFSYDPNDQTKSLIIDNLLKLTKKATGFLFDDLIAQYDTLIAFIDRVFKSSVLKLKLSASELVSELISFGNKEEMNKIKQFLFNILQTTLECFNANEEEMLKTQMTTIIEMCTIEPGLWKKHFDDLFVLSQKIVDKKDYDDDKIRELGFELTVNLIEQKPSFVSRESKYIKILFESLYKYSLEMPNDIENNWLVPQGNNYDDIESFTEEQVTFAQGMLDRLVECLGIDPTLPVLNEIINGLVSQNDWKYKYIGLYSLASLSSYEDDMATVEIAFKVVFALTKHEHPKVRFAAINCISKFCDNFNPHFQKKYVDTVIPLMIELFNAETILRNQCEIIETVTSFIQFATSEVIMPYVSKLFEMLFAKIISQSPIILTKSILDCVLEIASTIEEESKPFAKKAFEIVLNFYKENYTHKSNKVLYGVLIENLTTIGPYTKEDFYKVVPDIVESIIELVQGIGFEKDPIRADLKNSLERLLPVLQSDFVDLIPKLVQTVLTLIKVRPTMSISSSPENEIDLSEILTPSVKNDKNESIAKKHVDLETTEVEDLAETLSLLNSIIETLESKFYPYIDLVDSEVLPLLSYPFSPKIRNKVAKILPNIMPIILQQEEKVARGKRYIQEIQKAIEKESENEIRLKLFSHFHDLLNNSGTILTRNEVNELFQIIMLSFTNVEKARIELLNKKAKKPSKKSPDDDSDDENIDDLINDDIETLEETQSQISDVIGVLFKTHKDLSDDIIKVILSEVLPKYVNPQASTFESRMAIYIADDMIEFLGMEKLVNIWTDLFKLLVTMMDKEDHVLRQAAAYGGGVFAQYTTQNFDMYALDLLKGLKEAMKYKPKDEDDEEDWGLAHDNIIASIGKVIFYHHDCQIVKDNMSDLVENWIINLPLKYDVLEAEKQHEWLSNMVLLKRELIPIKCLPHSFKALVKIYKAKISNDVTNEKIEQIFNEVKNNQELKTIVEGVYQSAENKVKKKLEKLIK